MGHFMPNIDGYGPRTPPRRWVGLRAVALATVLLAVRLAWVHAYAATPLEVRIEGYAFAPRELTVPAGTTVVWTNHDPAPHTVTSTTGAFGSPALDQGERFSFTFEKPGEYAYFCTLHPQMTGTVHVQ